jgi:molybdopterin-guanine dinucleotide biosynthesis protein A
MVMCKTPPLPVTAIILAGGESSRMAAPKAFLTVGGTAIIEREMSVLGPIFNEVIISANDPGPFSRLGRRVVPDDLRFSGVKGPLAGVYSGLSEAGNEYGFVVACDMPFISHPLVVFMAGLRDGFDLVIPRVRGYAEPLLGLYGKTALKTMEDALSKGEGRLQGIFEGLKVRYVEEPEIRPFDPELRSFININTPGDLAMAEKLA